MKTLCSKAVLPLPILAILLLFATIATRGQESEFRTFSNSDGKKIEAKAISVSGENIKIEMRDGRKFDLPIAKLSPADREWIDSWKESAAADYVPELRISFDEKVEKSNDETGFVYIEKFSPELSITNREENFDLTDAKATILLIGEEIEKKDTFLVLSKETLSFSLVAGESKELEGKKSETKYATIQAYGAKFSGYAVIIENAGGKIIANIGSRGWDKNPANALKAGEGSSVREDFASKP